MRSLKANVESYFLLMMTIKHNLREKAIVWAVPHMGLFEKVECVEISPVDNTSRAVLTPQPPEEGRETQLQLCLS